MSREKAYSKKVRRVSQPRTSRIKLSMIDRLTVGDVVLLQKKERGLGIVRYKGPLHCYDEEKIWLGIELTTPDGKNDGSVQDTKYFNCAPNHGVFVRQVRKKISSTELLDKIARLEKENQEISVLKHEIRENNREFCEYKEAATNFEHRVTALVYPLLTNIGAGALVQQLEDTGRISSEIILRPKVEGNDADAADEKSSIRSFK